MIGALTAYVSDPAVRDFQPMGANFGILPLWRSRSGDKRLRAEALARRALDSLDRYRLEQDL